MSADPSSSYRELHAKINNQTDVLIKRFESIAALAPMTLPNRDDPDKPFPKDKNLVATEAYAIETQAAAMIRAVEELLDVTKTLKEAWLFGQIASGDEEGEVRAAEEEADANARVVGEGLRGLLTREITSESPAMNGSQ